MKNTLFLKFIYIFLCALTFLSFGTYTVLSNVKNKAVIAVNDVAKKVLMKLRKNLQKAFWPKIV
jgi:hypothetical protein